MSTLMLGTTGFLPSFSFPFLLTEKAAGRSGPLHHGVTCDGCEGSVRGIRYKCKTCEDYDLCSRCYKHGIHSQHRMHKIEQPLDEGKVLSIMQHLAL